jgi:hypothetical protein
MIDSSVITSVPDYADKVFETFGINLVSSWLITWQNFQCKNAVLVTIFRVDNPWLESHAHVNTSRFEKEFNLFM